MNEKPRRKESGGVVKKTIVWRYDGRKDATKI